VFYVWLWQILSWRVSLSSNRFHCLIMWLLTYSNIYVIICAFVCGPSLCCSSLEISRTAVASHRHVNFMHICDCHTDSLIAAFFLHISANCAYRIFFCINWLFRRHFNIICDFLLGFVTSTIWLPTEWHHPCVRIPVERDGVVGFKQFCTVFPHISAAYLAFMRSAYF